MVLGQQVEFNILHHLSHPTLVGGLKDDESDGGYHLKAKVGRNLAKSSISVTFTCFRSVMGETEILRSRWWTRSMITSI